jgi:hypothetical protein
LIIRLVRHRSARNDIEAELSFRFRRPTSTRHFDVSGDNGQILYESSLIRCDTSCRCLLAVFPYLVTHCVSISAHSPSASSAIPESTTIFLRFILTATTCKGCVWSFGKRVQHPFHSVTLLVLLVLPRRYQHLTSKPTFDPPSIVLLTIPRDIIVIICYDLVVEPTL